MDKRSELQKAKDALIKLNDDQFYIEKNNQRALDASQQAYFDNKKLIQQRYDATKWLLQDIEKQLLEKMITENEAISILNAATNDRQKNTGLIELSMKVYSTASSIGLQTSGLMVAAFFMPKEFFRLFFIDSTNYDQNLISSWSPQRKKNESERLQKKILMICDMMKPTSDIAYTEAQKAYKAKLQDIATSPTTTCAEQSTEDPKATSGHDDPTNPTSGIRS